MWKNGRTTKSTFPREEKDAARRPKTIVECIKALYLVVKEEDRKIDLESRLFVIPKENI